MLQEPQRAVCQRCSSREVSLVECPQCEALSFVSCRRCSHEQCRDELCELSAHKKRFARQLRIIMSAMMGLLFVMFVARDQLQGWTLWKPAPVAIPSLASVPPDAGATFAWLTPSSAPGPLPVPPGTVSAGSGAWAVPTGVPAATPSGEAPVAPTAPVAMPPIPAATAGPAASPLPTFAPATPPPVEASPIPVLRPSVAVLPPVQAPSPRASLAAPVRAPEPATLSGTPVPPSGVLKPVARPSAAPVVAVAPPPVAEVVPLPEATPAEPEPPVAASPDPKNPFLAVGSKGSTPASPNPYRHVAGASPTPEDPAAVLPGVAPLGGEGFPVPELDERELRSGRVAAERAGRREREDDASPRPVRSPGPELPQLAETPPTGDEWTRQLAGVMREAMGAKYSPTGNSPKVGLSAGGLVHWVFRRMGIRAVPQLVEDQMEMAGVRLDSDDYRPQVGDLLFFTVGKLKHVGIMLDPAQNTFVTVVPAKGGVVVADFNHPFFRTRFLFARRIAPPAP